MRRRHNISPKPEEGTFTYALLLAKESLRKIPLNTAINICKYSINSLKGRKVFWKSERALYLNKEINWLCSIRQSAYRRLYD